MVIQNAVNRTYCLDYFTLILKCVISGYFINFCFKDDPQLKIETSIISYNTYPIDKCSI